MFALANRRLDLPAVAEKLRESDKVFGGSVAELYQEYLVPLIFEPYASDLVDRLGPLAQGSLLEVAAGTGVVTRRLAAALPPSVSLVATDLNQPMLDEGKARGTSRPVEWRQADAQELPFPDRSFDVVVCQFGVMFFPDKAKAFSEARRVLRPGGRFLFNVWDRIEENEFADEVTNSLAPVFPADPPRFLARTPYGYHDRRVIERDLAAGGFAGSASITTVREQSRAASPQVPAIAFCQGSPLRSEIEARGRLDQATAVAAEAIARRFGRGAVTGKIQAHVIQIRG